jgi:LacI family transcriptional regulator
MNNTTLKKISEILGLSISTISRALKDHPDISDKTKLRVVELATTLDYEPNANAINLRTSNSKLFGLIVPSISNSFYNSFIASVEEDSRRNGYSLMILQSGDDPAIEITNLKLCRQNRITGLFVCISPETTNIDVFLKLKEIDIPVIFFDKVPESNNCNKVCVADSLSATIAANAIINKKKKKVLALFGNTHLLMTK